MRIKIVKSSLKAAFMAVFLLFITSGLRAANYYFSFSQGNDSYTPAQAQSAATPWKTIDKLNSIFSQLNPGDSVLFKCGDTFYGSITVNKSGSSSAPIVFSSYGSGVRPQITGYTALSGWSAAGTNIWEAILPAAQQRVASVLVNGSLRSVGRYPNADAASKGYLTFESASGNSSVTDLQLSAAPDWTGGEIVIRKARWVIDRNLITQHSGNTITYTSQSGYGASAGYGYFIQNHPKTLDLEGEWYYTAATRKFGIYAAAAPASGSIRVSTVQNLVSIISQSNISFAGLTFTGANAHTFYTDYAQNVRIKDCELLYSGSNAITAWNTNYFTIEGNVINHTNNNACSLENCNNITIKNNSVTNTGISAGMGDGDSGSYEALLLSGSNQLIEGNTIDSSGYIAVTFRGANVVVKNNVISNFSFVKDDGSGIYTWNNVSNPPAYTGEVISGNIVLNGLGAGEGTPDPDHKYANGIYMDDNAGGVEISGNTVANCVNYGIYIHNAHDLVIQNNTVFNNAVQLEVTHDDIAPYPIRNVALTGNKFIARLASQSVAEFKTIGNDISSFGTFDYNYYSRPFFDDLQIGALHKENGNYIWNAYSLDGWKAAYGMDQHSGQSPFPLAPFKINSYAGANLFANGSFDANVSGASVYSSASNAGASWSSGALDGGALKIAFSGTTGSSGATVIFSTGGVSAGHNYVLKFSLKGTATKQMEAYLRQGSGSYSDLVAHNYFTVSASRSEQQLLFTPTGSAGSTNIIFLIPDGAGTVYIDNVQLTDANITLANPADSIKFVYNTSATNQVFTLNGPYTDITGSNYGSTISLLPYSSAVLLKKGTSQATPADTMVTCSATGNILREQWDAISGNDVSNIPVQTLPTSSNLLTSFEAPTDIADNYGARIRGYVCPPLSGNYVFWIASDDASELWLSSDSNSVNKTRVAYSLSWTAAREWNKFASQKSASVYLLAGHKYYIEALHKEGGGGDNLAVAWQLPNGTIEAPIPGSRLSPYIVSLSSQTISFPAIGSKSSDAAPFSLSATAGSGLTVSFTVVSGPATISGSTIALTGTGTVTIQASQSGNSLFSAAAPVTQSFEVTAAAASACSATGTILREQWNGISGNSISSIPLQTAPAGTSTLTSFESPSNVADNFGARIRGYICPPQSGNYIFRIAADDAAQLWFSSSDSEAKKVLIASVPAYTGVREWTRYASQQSAALYLLAGHKYYIEALHKEGDGGDHLAVAWQLPNGTVEAPVPGSRLSPFTAVPSSQTISFPAIGSKISSDAPFSLSATAGSGLTVSFTVVSGPATISGSIITLTGTGTVTIQASQSGNSLFSAAAPVTQSFEVTAAATASACTATGTILREQWDNIGGNSISSIPVQNTPDRSQQLTAFESPTNYADNFGARIRGYICPPQSGNYVFWIAADDVAELWLSTSDDAGNKIKIATVPAYTGVREWNKYASQKSASVYLQAGKKYYIEALHKEGDGGDNLAVAWQLPDGTTEAPISGSRLSPVVSNIVSACAGTGTITREQWNGISGNSISSIPLQTTSATTGALTSFESPSNIADNFGARIRGYVCPPLSGNYIFWIAADDVAELWLSTSDDAGNKIKIASVPAYTGVREWNKYASQKSASIYLLAGQKYYIEALHKEGDGGDNLAVAWQLPNGNMEAPVPGTRLLPYTVANVYGSYTKAEVTDSNTTIKENRPSTAADDLKIYPNPLKTAATIEVSLKEAGLIHLDLLDEHGRTLKQIAAGLVNESVGKKFVIYTTGLNSGVYIVRLVTQTKSISRKIIVLQQ